MHVSDVNNGEEISRMKSYIVSEGDVCYAEQLNIFNLIFTASLK